MTGFKLFSSLTPVLHLLFFYCWELSHIALTLYSNLSLTRDRPTFFFTLTILFPVVEYSKLIHGFFVSVPCAWYCMPLSCFNKSLVLKRWHLFKPAIYSVTVVPTIIFCQKRTISLKHFCLFWKVKIWKE